MPIIGGSGYYHRGVRCPLEGDQVHMIGRSEVHYRGDRCPIYRVVPAEGCRIELFMSPPTMTRRQGVTLVHIRAQLEQLQHTFMREFGLYG